MSERQVLTASIATTIRSYREGEIQMPDEAHVDRWASQFTPEQQLAFLREFNHVIGQTFVSKQTISEFLGRLVTNRQLTGADPKAFWRKAVLLQIQQAGNSQEEMNRLFTAGLLEQLKVNIQSRSTGATHHYIYLDDALFSGDRIASDLEAWVANSAPQQARVTVIVIASHTHGQHWISEKRLPLAVARSGKRIEIEFRQKLELENRQSRKDVADVLWPTTIPEDRDVQAYVNSESRFPLITRTPGGPSTIFSSEAGRQVLESEFMKAGVRIRSKIQSPKARVRPLGYSSFGAGFGSLVVTYRNCPNNCPLPLWWGDPNATGGALRWYPLLPRKTYADHRSNFDFDPDEI